MQMVGQDGLERAKVCDPIRQIVQGLGEGAEGHLMLWRRSAETVSCTGVEEVCQTGLVQTVSEWSSSCLCQIAVIRSCVKREETEENKEIPSDPIYTSFSWAVRVNPLRDSRALRIFARIYSRKTA